MKCTLIHLCINPWHRLLNNRVFNLCANLLQYDNHKCIYCSIQQPMILDDKG